MTAGFSLKDQLFNADTVGRLADHFGAADIFDPAPFVAQVMYGLAPLELKQRMNLIADVLEQHLPKPFPQACAAIRQALPPPLDPHKTDDDFGHFIYAPLGIYVERHGIPDHLDLSLTMLQELTQRFSMEYSVRAFLNYAPDMTLQRMQLWCDHDHYHVRRLVSEGTRPRLPWGQNVGLTPAQTLPLLDRLHSDRTRFVTRSVANHLNDLTKDHPGAVIARLADWQKQRAQSKRELDWINRHALRSLIKSGDPAAMAHLGYDANVALKADVAIAPNDLAIGEAAQITASILTQTDAPLIVDYVIDFVKANGKTAPKTFKFKVLTAKAGQMLTLSKKHLFKKGATTFTHYPGAHRVTLQVNGQKVAQAGFTLS